MCESARRLFAVKRRRLLHSSFRVQTRCSVIRAVVLNRSVDVGIASILILLGLILAQPSKGGKRGEDEAIPGFQAEPPGTRQATPGDVHFQLIRSGRAAGKDVDSVDISIYRADDGTLVQHRFEIYHSSSQARNKMQSMLEKAKTILEQGNKLDNQGKIVGDRAVLLPERSQPTIVWREANDLYVISSEKLGYARAFERHLDKSSPSSSHPTSSVPSPPNKVTP